MKFFKDEKGAALLVEAAFIYPIVIIVVVFMIYLGMFVYESAVIHDMAATTSMMAAKSVSFPGYDELGDFCIKGGDDDTEITVGMVNKAYEDMKPYRYIVTGKVDKVFEENLTGRTKDILLKTEEIDCSIDVDRHLLSRRITVKLEKEVSMPQIFEMIGLNDKYLITATEMSITSDPAEFVRNTDITANVTGYLAEKFKLGEKFSALREKISGTLENLSINGDKEK
ncbi:MAG: hypothetical protein E7510_03700 [Ruminococcus sp.]|nr:hypothetical protein [Ruminococcus sp.]